MIITVSISSYRGCIAKLCMALQLKVLNRQYSVLKGRGTEDDVPLFL